MKWKPHSLMSQWRQESVSYVRTLPPHWLCWRFSQLYCYQRNYYLKPNETYYFTSEQNHSTLLADGFARDFVDLVLTDDSFIELLHQLAYDFISENIPLTDDDMKFELGLMLLERIKLGTKRGYSPWRLHCFVMVALC